MSSLLKRANAIVQCTPATDMSAKKGSLVTLSEVSGVLTCTLSASASVYAKGVVLEGSTVAQASTTVAIIGAVSGTVPVKLGGTVAAGAYVQQNSDDTVITDATSGARVLVGVVLAGGISGDIVEMATITPTVLS